MCCFSGPVHVHSTSIFARRVDDRTQALAYEMTVASDQDVAMVLPLPTDANAGEEAVRFVDLSAVPQLFSDLDGLFPSRARGGPVPVAAAAATLAVHIVGSFEASFVPRPGDFDRLDLRFRLAPEIAEGLAGRDGMGFAVFQLRGSGTRPFHPIGLTFRSRAPDVLFFPTVHVHDGTIPMMAVFDHALYAQRTRVPWDRSRGAPGEEFERRAGGLVSGDEVVMRRRIVGEHPNVDIVVSTD